MIMIGTDDADTDHARRIGLEIDPDHVLLQIQKGTPIQVEEWSNSKKYVFRNFITAIYCIQFRIDLWVQIMRMYVLR